VAYHSCRRMVPWCILTVIFSCYDFDGTGKLTIDEVTLAFKVSRAHVSS
jgi:hypothetical protein